MRQLRMKAMMRSGPRVKALKLSRLISLRIMSLFRGLVGLKSKYRGGSRCNRAAGRSPIRTTMVVISTQEGGKKRKKSARTIWLRRLQEGRKEDAEEMKVRAAAKS